MEIEKKPKSNSVLMILIVVLLLIILSLLAYIAIKIAFPTPIANSNTSSSLSSQSVSSTTSEVSVSSQTSSIDTSSNSSVKVGTYKVYMLNQEKFALGLVDFSDYFDAVNRNTTRLDIGTFVIEETIKGPSDSEKTLGLVSTFGAGKNIVLSGASNCSGKDFSFVINDGIGEIQFCRTATLAGDSSGSILEEQLYKSLTQFPTIKHIRVINRDHNCLNDMSGLGECLK